MNVDQFIIILLPARIAGRRGEVLDSIPQKIILSERVRSMIKQLANDCQNPLWFSEEADWNSKDGHTIAVWEGCIK